MSAYIKFGIVMSRILWVTMIFLSWIAGGAACTCRQTPADGRQPSQAGDLPQLRVSDEAANLLFTYLVADGTFQTVDRIADIPPEARSRVIVFDTALTPEERQSSRIIFVADLTSKRADGSYPCRPVSRFRFERDLLRESATAGALPEDCRALAPSPEDKVVLYATEWCSVCRAAERYLSEAGIPFLKKDIEADRSAERELTCKALRSGSRVEGVPVLDIGGQLLVGFDREEVARLASKLKKTSP